MAGEIAKHKPNLEHIPDILTGKLLQDGVTVESVGLSHDTNNNLSLFVELLIHKEKVNENLDRLILSISRNAYEFLNFYPQIETLVIYVTETSKEQRWSTSKRLKIRSEIISDWYIENISNEKYLNLFIPEDNWLLHQETRASSWKSLIVTKDNNLIHTTDAIHLNRVPTLLMGKLWNDEFALDTADIHRDKDGEIVLYAEFPVDEKTEAKKNANILRIAECAIEFLLNFPELKRLSIWTRPEYEDMVAISSFWWSRENLIEWSQNKFTDYQLLELCKKYNT